MILVNMTAGILEGRDIKFNRTTSIKIAGDKVTVTDTANDIK